MPNDGTLFGAYTPTTSVWDPNEIFQTNLEDPEALRELLVRLYQNLNLMANVVNSKESSYYDTQQFITGQQFFPNPSTQTGTTSTYRPTSRVVINFGALPNTGTKTVAHGITVNQGTTWTRIYGAATDPVGLTGIPIPDGNGAYVVVTATNVSITTGSNLTNYTTTLVVLEYMSF